MHLDPDESVDPIARRLEAMPEIEPPAGLRSAIMEAIRAERPDRRHASRPVILHSRRRVFAAGWAAAAVIVLLFLVIGRPRESREPFATMAPAAATYRSDGVTLTVRREGDVIALEPAVTPQRYPVTISVGWDPKSADFAGVSGVTDASSGKDQTTFTLRSPSERAMVRVRAHAATSSMEVRVSIDNQEAIRQRIALR